MQFLAEALYLCAQRYRAMDHPCILEYRRLTSGDNGHPYRISSGRGARPVSWSRVTP